MTLEETDYVDESSRVVFSTEARRNKQLRRSAAQKLTAEERMALRIDINGEDIDNE